jgi:hypothetical protein
VVSATFESLTTLPATFTASGLVPGDPAETRFKGVVLDNGLTPIPGAVVRIDHTTVEDVTDEEGQFMLENVPVGKIHLMIDPSSSPRPETFPPLAFETVTVAGQTNVLGQPILIPALDNEGSKVVGGPEDVVLKMPGVAGLELTVFANSVTCRDGSRQCRVTISQVHLDKVPMPPPSGTIFMPPAWTVQPGGTRFNPPARISIPNDGMPPGRQIDIFQFDHDLNQFINIGKGTTSEDGLVIVSDPGFGITAAGWGGCGQPQPPTTCTSACGPCQKCDTTSGSCVADTGKNGQSCDDGNTCTKSDTCSAGSCSGTDKGPICGPNSAITVTYTAPTTTHAPSMTTPATTNVNTPTFAATGCIDKGSGVWRFRVQSVTSTGRIDIYPTPAANTPNPTAGGNVNAGNYCAIIKDLADYTSTGIKGPNWHVTQATIDHENYHWNTEWKGSFNTAWSAAESAMEGQSVSCSAADDPAAALGKMNASANTEFQKGFANASAAYAKLGDGPGDPPYVAGQAALNAMITQIRNFATAQKFPACPP